MGALVAFLLGLALLGGGLMGKDAFSAFVTEPQKAKIQKELMGKQHELQTKGMTMLSERQLAQQEKLFKKQSELAAKGRESGVEQTLLNLLGGQAQGSQAVMGQLLSGLSQPAPPQSPAMMPGMGVVDMLRMR